MGWHLYSLNFRLRSPMHIGFHKVMHIFRTRAYVPARPFWGVLTLELTRNFKSSNYREVGEFLKNVMRFGYLYLSDENNLFIPRYTDEGLKFGKLSQIEFEKRFISSQASSSIEPYSFTAEEGMLHEIEFISPYEIHTENVAPKSVFLKGLLWVFENLEGDIEIQINEDDFSMVYGKNEIKFSDLTKTLQVGGERKYGFGLMKLEELKEVNDQKLEYLGFKGRWMEEKDEIKLELRKDEFIWAHVKFDSNLKIKGSIEPVVGRNWNDKGAGRELKSYGLHWVPGSTLMEDKTFKITENFGLWEIVK